MSEATVTVDLSYRPNRKQKEFHGLSAKYRAFCGGWGNGKTSGGCAEFFLRLIEFPGTNSIVARKTRPELRTTTWDMLVNGDTSPGGWTGIPREVIKTINKSDLFIELWNGSKVHGLPLDDPKKLENFNLGLFLIDQAEEIEEDIFLKFQGRLRQHHSPREGIVLHNPDGHNWLWRRFINPERKDRWKQLYKAVEATPFDNPNLPPDYLEQFESLPDHWYQRYVLGSHEVFVGQIFTDFNPDLHVIDPFPIPTEWERWCCIDPGIRHEGCVSWMARDYLKNWYYYREILEPGRDVAWWAEQITTTEESYDCGGPNEEMFVRLIGPESQQRSQQDGRTVKGVFEEEGIDDLEISDRDPIARISRIASSLRPSADHARPDWASGLRDDQYGSAESSGAPRLYIFSTCEKLIEYLPQYRWRPQRSNFTEELPPEAPRKKDDHNIDCLGHILVAAGDSDPEVPDNSKVRNTESREADEHFEGELALVGGRNSIFAGAPWRAGLEDDEY